MGTTTEHSVENMAQNASLLCTLLSLIMKPVLGDVDAGKRLCTDHDLSSSMGTTTEHSVEKMAQDASLLCTLLSLIMKPILGGIDDKKIAVDLKEALTSSAAASEPMYLTHA
jgi:MFS-type transporter involved in bile tolerance (Atg22 family)